MHQISRYGNTPIHLLLKLLALLYDMERHNSFKPTFLYIQQSPFSTKWHGVIEGEYVHNAKATK